MSNAKPLRAQTPHYEVSEGTANLLQAYHEAKAKINQVINFVAAYQQTNQPTITLQEDTTFNELKITAAEFLCTLRYIVLENVEVEIDGGENCL